MKILNNSMQLEFNWIQILTFDSNILNGIQIELNSEL